MAEDIAKIGIDVVEIQQGLNAVSASMDRTTKSADKLDAALTKGGTSKSSYRMGQLGMQVQDVAVQMQNATDKTQAFFTVTAQQAPQFLSIFGAGGAIVGGVIGIGAAIGTAVYQGQKNFSELIDKANETADALEINAKVGGIPEIISGIEKAQKSAKDLQLEIEDYTKGISGYMATWGAAFSDAFGGDSAIERIEKSGDAQAKILKAEMVSRRTLISLAEKEIEVSKLRQKGQNDLADQKERELALEKEIAAINAKKLDSYAKQLLIANAVEKSRVKEMEALDAIGKRNADEADKRLKEAERNQKEADKALQKTLDAAEKIARQKQIDDEKEARRVEKINEDEKRRIERLDNEKQKAADKEKKQQEEIQRAKDDVADAEKRGSDAMLRRKSIADQIKAKEIEIAKARAEANKHLIGTTEHFKALLKLQDLRNEKDDLFAQRAANYAKSFATGHRADREQAKQAKEQARGERRLREAEARKGNAVRGAASGLGNQQKRGNGVPNIQPNGPNVQPAQPAAPVQMVVDTLSVNVLKPR